MYTVSLIRFVTAASLVAAALLATAKKVEPEQKEFPRRFLYFFVRCWVTLGFWAAILWMFSAGSEPPGGLP